MEEAVKVPDEIRERFGLCEVQFFTYQRRDVGVQNSLSGTVGVPTLGGQFALG